MRATMPAPGPQDAERQLTSSDSYKSPPGARRVADRPFFPFAAPPARLLQQQRFANDISNSPRMVAQRRQRESFFGNVMQRQVADEPVTEERSRVPNRTGLPDHLKSGVESLSGISLDNVEVHFNSSRPAQLNALAYTQGSEIHVAPGQQRHLPHEAWHVVQQAQGRVRPTMQMKGGVPVNDDAGLEHEADVMGAKSLTTVVDPRTEAIGVFQRYGLASPIVQRYIYLPGKKKPATIEEVIDWLAANVPESKTDSKKSVGKLSDKLKAILQAGPEREALEKLVADKNEKISLSDPESAWEVLGGIGLENAQAIRDPDLRAKSKKKAEQSSSSSSSAPRREKKETVPRGKREKETLSKAESTATRVDIKTLIQLTDQSFTELEKACGEFLELRFIGGDAIAYDKTFGFVKEQSECQQILLKEIQPMQKHWLLLKREEQPDFAQVLSFQEACTSKVAQVKEWEGAALERHPFQSHYINCIRILRVSGIGRDPLFTSACDMVRKNPYELSPIKKWVGEGLGRELFRRRLNNPHLIVLKDVYAIRMFATEAEAREAAGPQSGTHDKPLRRMQGTNFFGIPLTDFDGVFCQPGAKGLSVISTLEAKGGTEDPTKQVNEKQKPALRNIYRTPNQFCFARMEKGEYVNINKDFDLETSVVKVTTAGPAAHFDIDFESVIGINAEDLLVIMRYLAYFPQTLAAVPTPATPLSALSLSPAIAPRRVTTSSLSVSSDDEEELKTGSAVQSSSSSQPGGSKDSRY